MDELVKNNLIEFAEKYFPTYYALMVSGSYVNGSFNEYSDIDLLIFTNEINYCYVEDFSYKDLKVQGVILSLKQIDGILTNDYRSGKGKIIHMISTGKILVDKNNYLTNLIIHCEELYLLGPPEKTLEELKLLKFTIITLLNKLKGGKEFEINVIYVMEIFEKIIILNLHYNKKWCRNGKYFAKELILINENLYDRLIKSLQEFYINQNNQLLISVVEENLLGFGEIPALNTVSKGLISVKKDYLVLQISNITDFYGFINRFYKLHREKLKEINLHELVLLRKSNTSPYNISVVQPDSTYLIIFEKCDRINNNILKDISSMLNQLYYQREEKISYPINFEIESGFGNTIFNTHIKNLLVKTSNIVDKIYLSESLSLILSIEFLVLFGKIAFKTKNDLNTFCQYLFESLFMKTFDNGEVFGTQQLTLSKNISFAKFLNQYNLQKHMLIVLIRL